MQCSLLKSFHSLDWDPWQVGCVQWSGTPQAGQKHKYLKEFWTKRPRIPTCQSPLPQRCSRVYKRFYQHILPIFFVSSVASTGIIVEFGSLMPSHALRLAKALEEARQGFSSFRCFSGLNFYLRLATANPRVVQHRCGAAKGPGQNAAVL